VKVIGIDASEAQVKKAPPAANIEFRVGVWTRLSPIPPFFPRNFPAFQALRSLLVLKIVQQIL
jgi:hypothetical protein